MRARMESLDMLANNIANTSTVAFKADREFYGVYVSEQDPGGPNQLESPLIEKHWTDFTQGTLLPTGNSLDVALTGNGFFAVDSPSGPLYTRNGAFRMGKAGSLETQDGYRVRVIKPDGRPAVLDPSKPVDIAPDGSVRQEGQELGRIETADLGNDSAVSKRGSTYFQWLGTGVPKPAPAATEMKQGVVESSNVPVAESAVRLVSVMRQFEMLQRAVTLGSEMNRRSLEEVAKVS